MWFLEITLQQKRSWHRLSGKVGRLLGTWQLELRRYCSTALPGLVMAAGMSRVITTLICSPCLYLLQIKCPASCAHVSLTCLCPCLQPYCFLKLGSWECLSHGSLEWALFCTFAVGGAGLQFWLWDVSESWVISRLVGLVCFYHH